MKKLIFLFILLFVSVTSFSQKSLTNEDLQYKYKFYKENPTPFSKTMSFDDWKTKHGFTEVPNNKPLNKKNEILNNNVKYTSGKYLIKGKNQLIGGLLCQTVAIGAIVYTLTAEPPKNATISELDSWENTQKTIDYGAGALSLIGLVLEISGLNNIGKAGIILSGNSVGIKVNF